MSDYTNIDTDAPLIYQYYSPPVSPVITPIVEGGVAPITTINGNSGQISGPANSIVTDPSTGYTFNGNGTTLTFSLSDAATARAAISAAKSGVNTDITQLNGASQVDVSSHYEVGGTQVVGAQEPAIANPTGGVTIDVEARAALVALLQAVRAHGLIDT